MKKLLAMLIIFGLPLLISGVYYHNWYSLEKTVEIAGAIRKYRLHVPFNYKEPSSLVIMLHGYGDNPRLMESYSEMSRLADEKGFIVVYPYGSNNEVDRSLSWNADFCCGVALFNKIDDVAYITKLKDKLVTKYDIDPSKVYLAGFSNGAMLALKIATEIPEAFVAYGAMAGTVGGQGLGSNGFVMYKPPKTPVKVIMIHGTDDPAVPFLGGLGKYQKKILTPMRVVSFAESKEFWMASGSQFEGITVEKRGHIWLGGPLELGIYGNIQGVNTSQEFWRFFNGS